MEILTINNLCKRYSDATDVPPIIQGLNLVVKQGEQVALLGSSGSGKTTLLNLVAGIDQASSGQVKIADTEILTLQEPQRTLWRRQHLGFVFQFFNLIPTLTVTENIALPLELCGEQTAKAEARVSQLLEKIQLPHCADRYPDTLSGGEQQRVAIARALIHKPSLLLADEPTGNLDEETGAHILSLLLDLAKEQQMTMLIVTHSRQVANAADRQLVLHKGKLEEQ